MKKKILSLVLACMMLLLSGGIPAVLAAEEITIVRGLEFYGEDGLPVETVKQGLLTAKITLRAETAQAPSVKLVLVGYQETDGVKRLYSVHESEDTVLEQGVDTELSAAAQITQEEISGRVEYKAMVWKGGYVGEMGF